MAFAPSTACGGIVGSWRAFGRQLLGPLVVHGCPHLNNCSVRRPSLPCRRLGAGPSSACSSRSRPQPRSSIAPRWWPSCSRCAEAALGINGFQVISDVTVVSLLRPLYTQPMLESFSFTPTLKSFDSVNPSWFWREPWPSLTV